MFDFKNYSPSLYFRNYSYEIAKALDTVKQNAINEAFELLNEAYLHIYPVLTYGNGGSAAIANHLMADLVKCVGHDCGCPPFHGLSLVSNSPLLTCMANDYGYSYALSKQIEMWPCYGTLCIGISSSGKSTNIINAFTEAQKRKDNGDGFSSVALVGFDGGDVLADNLADVIIHVKSDNYGIVEDCHSIILHSLIQKLRINNTNDISKVRL